MIKGWRNNPEWCKYYAERDALRYQRMKQLRSVEMAMARAQADYCATLSSAIGFQHETQRAD